MKEFCSYLKFVWKYTKNQKGKFIKCIFLSFISMMISIVVPILSAKIIIYLTGNEFYQLILASIVIFLVENLRNIIEYFAKYYSQVVYRESFTEIQTELGREILKLENKCIDQNSSGVFIQRLTNDTGRLASIFNVLNKFISSIITDIGIFIAIFLINKIVFIYLFIMVIIMYILEYYRTKKYNDYDKIYRKNNENTSGFVGELVRGIRDIKMLNAEDSFIDELHHKIIEVNNDMYTMQNVDRKFRICGSFLIDFNDLMLIILLVVLIQKEVLVIANALIIYNYASRVPSIVYFIGTLLESVKDFNLSASRIFSIINSDGFQKETFGNKHIDIVEGNFEFKNVDFSYDDKKVLNQLSFQIKANETVAFVGKSGVGKSTIFNLLCKMYSVDSGTITIDGMDIKKLDKDTIRGNITIINQNPYIFNLSIRDNLKLVKKDLTDAEMIEACKLACLDDFINELPEGYDTIIGEGGVNLSGGQKQRLAIARAFVQKTEIILFDEATSALDNETQSSIQKAIENMKNEYTILIIAHRLSTIIHSDRILFINDGRIECQGTHEELLKKSKNYKQLYESEIKHSN